MTKDGGRRIATSSGAMLADPDTLGNVVGGVANEDLFEPDYWAQRGELADVARGRGAAWFILRTPRQWALRHYRRGGFIARFSRDRYVWAGEQRVRAFAEWRLLAALTAQGLPVPKPVAARYCRRGPWYRCDLITQRIANAEPLSAVLIRTSPDAQTWQSIGATLARFHAAGVDHADLNAHNILIDGAGAVSLIDFDRGRIRAAGSWAGFNLSRLRRSLVKVARDLPPGRFSAAAWDSLLAGYRS